MLVRFREWQSSVAEQSSDVRGSQNRRIIDVDGVDRGEAFAP